MSDNILYPSCATGPSLYLDDFDNAARGEFLDLANHPDRWTLVDGLQGARGCRLLMTPLNNTAPRLSLTANVSGPHAVYVGYYGAASPLDADGLYVRIAGEPHLTRITPPRFEPVYAEAYYKTVDCNETITIEIESLGLRSALDYIRLEPVNASPAPLTDKRSISICDFVTSMNLMKPAGFEAGSCLRQQKDAGFDIVLWKAFKVVCEWHTNVGVRRDMGVDYDTLKQAVDEAKKVGIDIYGWMRFNNEDSQPNSLFNAKTPMHLQHPEARQMRKDGVLRPRTGFAFPQVRQHKVDLVREVAGYGVDGICIDVLRHPPMVEWDMPMVEAYKEQFGHDPRDEPGDGSERWLRFKAEAFTQFLRDCRAAIDVPLMVRTMDQPWRNLVSGCDVQTWLDEGLVDSLIFAAHLPNANFYPQKIDLTHWLNLAGDRAAVYGQVWNMGSIIEAEAIAADLYDQGVAGVAVYETDYAVARPWVREHLWRFNRPDALRYRKVRD